MTQATPHAAPPAAGVPVGAAARRTGWALSALVVAFLVFDGGIKVVGLDVVHATMTALGLPTRHAFGLGVLTLAIAVLYALPRTACLGAVLLTALLGGAVATHLRVESPVFSHQLFGVYVGVLAWGGLWLREPRLRALLPVRRWTMLGFRS